MNEYNYFLIDDYEIAERDEAIGHIHKEMLDVNEIFKMLAHLSHEQGCLLNNIEENIDNVVENVESADIQIVSADKKQKQRNKCLWYLLLILFIFLIIILVLLFTL
jgi:t-SNARE complex subunit (syntaxin)